MTLDPVFAWLVRIGLALLFATAAWHKAVAPGRFVASVKRYRLLPARAVGPAAMALPGFELAIALGMLLDGTVMAAAAGAVSLFSLYTVAMAVNLRRGRRDLDCGCFGPSTRTPIHWGLVGRNAFLIAAALAAMLPIRDRALGWVDVATLACGLVAGCLTWTAAQRLAANAHWLKGHVE